MFTYLRVGSQQLKSLVHLPLLNAASEVQKVGWLPSVEINDVTGSHGQPGSIHCRTA